MRHARKLVPVWEPLQQVLQSPTPYLPAAYLEVKIGSPIRWRCIHNQVSPSRAIRLPTNLRCDDDTELGVKAA
jgi:hypothetical protein